MDLNLIERWVELLGRGGGGLVVRVLEEEEEVLLLLLELLLVPVLVLLLLVLAAAVVTTVVAIVGVVGADEDPGMFSLEARPSVLMLGVRALRELLVDERDDEADTVIEGG